MAKYHRQSKGKVIKPIFIVFCEGESEEAYVSFIKSRYKVPIEIKTRITSTKINQKYVSGILNRISRHKKDKSFLLYDLDRPDIVKKLRSVKKSILLGSNPCIELWYILHTCNVSAETSSSHCVRQLEGICKGYRKGFLCDKLRHELVTGEDNAIKRAKNQTPDNNPSTTVYKLIEELRKVQF
jgi:hypothetical protein